MLLATVAAFSLFLLVAPAAWSAGNVDVTVVGSGSGTVTSTSNATGVAPGEIDCNKAGGPICSGSFSKFGFFGPEPATVTLTAAADLGGGPFVGWVQGDEETPSEGCTIPPEANPTCVLTLNGDPGPTAEIFAVFGTPPDPPLATTDGTGAGPAGHLATLEGRVNPNGLAVVNCRFVYGTTTEYGQTTPCVPAAGALGDGTEDVVVSATTTPLEPNTTYHFRLRASNVGGTGQGKDRTFTTGPAPSENCPNAAIRAAQGIEVLLLPDCMALEQVSPSIKGNQPARLPEGSSAVSADGDRVLFNSVAALGGSPNNNGLGGDSYLATRGASGWTTEPITPPFGAAAGYVASSFTPDFSRWIHDSFSQYFDRRVGGFISPISPPLVNLASTSGSRFKGNSADHSHVYFSPEGSGGLYLPGDPKPAGTAADPNLYVAQLDSLGQPSLALFARDRDGKAWGGNCSAHLGGALGEDTRNQGAISPDGSRVYFSTRPDQPETGDCLAASELRFMERLETPTGPEIKGVIENECDREVPDPLCATDAGDDFYQGASVDQTRIYFTTNRQLADTDLDGSATSCSTSAAVPGCDLYLYDRALPQGERLIQVSAGEASAATPGSGANVRDSITAISADGSHVYFVAQSVLTTDKNPEGKEPQAGQDNLYLYQYPERDIAFIGTLDAADGGRLFGGAATWQNDAYPVPSVDAQGNSAGDGHILVFLSKAALTSDDTDGSRDIFRYDSGSGALERVSEAGPGGADDGGFDVGKTQPGFWGRGTDLGERARWVSEDGETVVFTTVDPLLPGDINGVEDVYLWRHGQVFRLPGSARPNAKVLANKPLLSPDGSTVAYHSSEQLLPSDGDSAQDVYVARVGGGFSTPIGVDCEGEACQGPPGTVSGEIGATTGSFAGAGNLKAEPNKPRTKHCPKGKRKVRARDGKFRCIDKKTDKGKPAGHNRRAAK